MGVARDFSPWEVPQSLAARRADETPPAPRAETEGKPGIQGLKSLQPSPALRAENRAANLDTSAPRCLLFAEAVAADAVGGGQGEEGKEQVQGRQQALAEGRYQG